MRLSFALTSLYVGVAEVVAQSQNATFVAQEIANISACGLACLEQTIPEVGCSLLNMTCQCSSSNLVSITGDCMLANCTFAESLELSKIQAAICELPYESRSEQIRVTIIVGATATYAAVLLRFISRYFLAQRFGLDDWFILAAICSDINFTSFGALLQHHGFGEHIWTIDVNTVQQLLYWFFICEIFYVLNIILIKTSILFFYLRAFPARSFRIQCWTMMAFCLTSGTAFIFTIIFKCRPISHAWNRDLKGTCFDNNTASWANAGINILQEILIVLLPIPELRILRLGTRKKIGVYTMFGLGLIVCILSIVRLWSLRTFGLTADPTWDNVPTTFWSTIEITAAITCACMPPIRGGFMLIFSNFWQTSIGNSAISSKKISMGCIGLSSSDTSGKSWSVQEPVSKSILDAIDEETHPGGIKIITAKPDFKHESTFNSGPDLMKPLPVPGSRISHISSLKR